jgi:outer membrane lipoprotein-sorting protein
LGKESVGGVEALKYRQEKKGDYYTVWIDPTTALPVQVNISDAQSSVGTTFSSFHWDVPVDSFQLTLEPPAGYTITSKTEN